MAKQTIDEKVVLVQFDEDHIDAFLDFCHEHQWPYYYMRERAFYLTESQVRKVKKAGIPFICLPLPATEKLRQPKGNAAFRAPTAKDR